MYSRGAAAIAEQIHSTKEEAQKIVNDFYKSFPTVKDWMDKSLADLKEKLYVEDFYGRRRRLTDITLEPYTVSVYNKGENIDFNPFINCANREKLDPAVAMWKSIIGASIINSNLTQMKAGNTLLNDEMSNKKYESLMKLAMSNTRDEPTVNKLVKLNNRLLAEYNNGYFTIYNHDTKQTESITITDEIREYCKTKVFKLFPLMYIDKLSETRIQLEAFTGRRAQAERQCVNARIQGSSATMTKIAMNKITNDPELNSYGFKLLIGVHDELIGEVKDEYAEAGANRLCEIMKTCVADLMSVSFKCDPSIVKAWYFDEMAYSLQDKLKDLVAEGKTKDEAITIIKQDNSEFYPEEIEAMLNFEG